MSTTVHLHVGIAKTGTTYLQRTLFANSALLERHGTRYPGPEAGAHFFGSLDLRGVTFRGHVYDRVEGAWARLVAQADSFGGSTLISHETLAATKPEVIERAVSSFATDDVRVVVTCRDLARQIPAVWQETLKNRSETPYDEFLDAIFAAWRGPGGREAGFWGAQDPVGVVARWSAAVGPEKVTLVTVPPAGADPHELWRRFAAATQLPDLDYAFATGANSSLGVAEAELLRRLNPLLVDKLDWPQYETRIKKRLAEGVLGGVDTRGRLRVPVHWRTEVATIAAAQISKLEQSGAAVVGALQDLVPRFDDTPTSDPGDLTDSDLLDTALAVVAELASRPQPARVAPVPLVPGLAPARRLVRALRAVRHRLHPPA